MTLKEKFEQYSNQEVWDKKNYNAEECVEIADEFAIGFAHFLAEHTYSCYESGWSNDFGDKELTTKELLEIYKKEKGL
jgi:hypothetical protein